MSESASRRFGLFGARGPKLPSERDWERAAVLVPRPAPRRPEMVSDGGGLPFALSALAGPPTPLDREDPAVAALLARLTMQVTQRPAAAVSPAGANSPSARAAARLEGWRELARSDSEALFGLGLPPRLVTVAVRRDGRRQPWICVASSAAEPLRATRDAIRASTWRLDPTHEPQVEDAMLRVLVTEQTFAAGQRAHGRMLPPDLFVDESELVLTMFVTPRPGYQSGAHNPETPVRVMLPHGVGSRRLIDGALFGA
jgi:hypothetical protein